MSKYTRYTLGIMRRVGLRSFITCVFTSVGGAIGGCGLKGLGRLLASRNLGWKCGIPRVSKLMSGNIGYFVACGLCRLLSMISCNRGLFCTFVVCSGMSVPC
jgi:hypothetical protein